jgi:hypothetical protein
MFNCLTSKLFYRGHLFTIKKYLLQSKKNQNRLDSNNEN